MKVILAEKPSVAREIARIVGATKREEGYLSGNGYAVTWAFGHLVMPALPDGYGIKGFHRDNLPIIPPVFTLVPRQVKTDKGYKPDSGVVAQIKIIAKLFRESERIIVATDAGREGELIYRYLYEYIGCATPFDRLWISSLTDKAIREGLENLKCGAEYDKLYYAAKARSEADWLVGINATQAITIAAGRGTYSLGRVQTPTLAMVCERYLENKRFVPEPVFQIHLSTDGTADGEVVKFSSALKWKEKTEAEAAYRTVKEYGSMTVTRVECKETVQEAPLLYDLTTLQKEANTKHGFSAEKTLSIAQKLYEAKLVTYPRTGSRHIPEDVFAEIPALLLTLKNHPVLGGYLSTMGNLFTPQRGRQQDYRPPCPACHGGQGKEPRSRRPHPLRYDCRAYAGSLFGQVRQGCFHRIGGVRRHGVHHQRNCCQASRMACGIWGEGSHGRGGITPLGGRRYAACKGKFADRRENEAQTATL